MLETILFSTQSNIWMGYASLSKQSNTVYSSSALNLYQETWPVLVKRNGY